LDFYYPTKSLGQHMVHFLDSVVPSRSKFSKKLITQDDKSNTYRYKYTWMVEIAPVCKDDLVMCNKRMCASMGGISPILLCYKVTKNVMLIDPNTMERYAVGPKMFWRDPPVVACSRKQLRDFVVLDIETPNDPGDQISSGKFVQGEITVIRDSEAEEDDGEFINFTHLAHQLKSGDTAAGYDLKNVNLGDDVLSRLRGREMPEVVIVRKTYPNRKNRQRSRKFLLKNLKKETPENNRAKKDKGEEDYETFLKDIEEDPEMRADMLLYKRKQQKQSKDDEKMHGSGGDSDDESDGFPEIDMNELIEDMTGSLVIDPANQQPATAGIPGSNGDIGGGDMKMMQ